MKRPQFVSELDNHLYAIYADDCVCAGNHEEGIHMLKGLVNKNPNCLAGWLQLAPLLLETGQLHQALGTMKSFTTLHPRYREGHRVFNQITPEMFKSRPK